MQVLLSPFTNNNRLVDVMSYIAPKGLFGKELTQATDIYSHYESS